MTARLADIFSGNLRRTRTAMRLSQAALAEKAQLSTSHLSMLELGERAPSIECLEALAAALNLEVWELLISPEDDKLPLFHTMSSVRDELERHIDSVFDRYIPDERKQRD